MPDTPIQVGQQYLYDPPRHFINTPHGTRSYAAYAAGEIVAIGAIMDGDAYFSLDGRLWYDSVEHFKPIPDDMRAELEELEAEIQQARKNPWGSS
jgi:hypothetical protein